jgi:hypothetical protein
MALQDVLGNVVVLSSIVPSLAISMVPQTRSLDSTATSQGSGVRSNSSVSSGTATSAVGREDVKQRPSAVGSKSSTTTSTTTPTNATSTNATTTTSTRVTAPAVTVNPASPASLLAQSVMATVGINFLYSIYSAM